MTVRPYTCDDEYGLLAAWNAALPYDCIDRRTLHRKVFLDPNFRREWLLVAEQDGGVVGFCLSLVRRVELEKTGLEPTRGFITAMGVVPAAQGKGVGSALLDAALDLFRGHGCTQVLIAPYAPNYFVPGVDEERYADGLAFLQRRGFQVFSRPLSMDTSLVTLDFAPFVEKVVALRERGVEIRPLRENEPPALLEFLREHMPGDWVRHAREVLDDTARGLADIAQFIVAARDGEIVGYCQSEGEHFGPFGVRDDCQGQGIGTAVLSASLHGVRLRGHHNAWVLWTSDDAARVYGRFGFTESRRFAVLRREL